MTTTRFEFEDIEKFSFEDYRIRNRSGASKGQVIFLPKPTGSASFTFELPAVGFYLIRTRFFDQSEGEAFFKVTLDGEDLATVDLDREIDGYRSVNLAREQFLSGGEVFTFHATRAGKDLVNLDSLDFKAIATGFISFAADSFSALENEGGAKIELIRTDGADGDIDVTIDVTSDAGTIPFQTTFADGETEKTIFFPLVDNAVFTGDQTFSLTLTSEYSALVGQTSTSTLTVLEDEVEPEPPSNSSNGNTPEASSEIPPQSSPAVADPTGPDPDSSPSPVVSDVVGGRIGTMKGSDRVDLIRGDRTNNVINGLNKNDALYGQQGNDTIKGNAGRDSIYGNQGNDKLSGGQSKDFVNGGSGSDRIRGDGGSDFLLGAKGNDFLSGGRGADKLLGGSGNDVLVGGNGSDILRGNDNDDVIVGGKGRDRLRGGAGSDTYVLEQSGGFDTFQGFQVAEDRIGLMKGLTFDDLTIVNGANGAVILQDEGLSLARIVNVKAEQITESLFQTVSNV